MTFTLSIQVENLYSMRLRFSDTFKAAGVAQVHVNVTLCHTNVSQLCWLQVLSAAAFVAYLKDGFGQGESEEAEGGDGGEGAAGQGVISFLVQVVAMALL